MTRGYVSSFDRERGFGFVSPHGDPETKVMFRRHAVEQGGSNARDLTPGRVVFFEVDPALNEPTPWEVAGTVITDEDAVLGEDATEED
jgi:cold shock CspA family protein